MAPKARVQKRLYYKIGEACKALEIQPYVLRYWETEFPALSPNKSRSGQRVYSEKEIGVIRRIKELLYDEGYTIAGAKKKLETELASGSLGPEETEEEAAEPAKKPRSRATEVPAREAGRGAGKSAARVDDAPVAEAPAQAPEAGIAEIAGIADAADLEGARSETPLSAARPALHPGAPRPQVSTAPPGQQPLLLDTQATERIESMRKGIQQAVDEARELLAFLAAKSPPRSRI